MTLDPEQAQGYLNRPVWRDLRGGLFEQSFGFRGHNPTIPSPDLPWVLVLSCVVGKGRYWCSICGTGSGVGYRSSSTAAMAELTI